MIHEIVMFIKYNLDIFIMRETRHAKIQML